LANSNEVHLEVTDSGTPMLPERIDRLVNGTTIEEIDRTLLEDSGRGLQIMHDLMDRVAYIKDGRLNRLQLTKCIPPSSLS
jgi:anti-sigma regulatory factor (Ser/Thr protein kinase)